CGAVKSRSKNLLASAAAAAEPKLPDRATKVKGADEANRRLMALSEEDRRSVFLRILALAKKTLRRDHAHLLSSASEAMERTVSWRPLIRHKSGGIQRGHLNASATVRRATGEPLAPEGVYRAGYRFRGVGLLLTYLPMSAEALKRSP